MIARMERTLTGELTRDNLQSPEVEGDSVVVTWGWESLRLLVKVCDCL